MPRITRPKNRPICAKKPPLLLRDDPFRIGARGSLALVFLAFEAGVFRVRLVLDPDAVFPYRRVAFSGGLRRDESLMF